MRKFIEPDRNQGTFLPPRISDWLPEKHLASFIVDVVNQLDLSEIIERYGDTGSTPYSPRILLALLFYGYATGVYSSRKIEHATYDSVAFRFISGNTHPDHDTIAYFRKRFLLQIEKLFVQILAFAYEMGLLKIGKVSIDGSKVNANASKHKAMSYKRACELEKRFKSEIAYLLKQAEKADNTVIDDGMDIPEEIAIRETRLRRIREAKRVIEKRAQVRYAEEKSAHAEKLIQREAAEDKRGKKFRGKLPEAPTPGPKEKDQYNFTDPESRIMESGGGFEQSYNVQAAVDTESLLIVGNDLTNHANDKKELEPALDSIPEQIGKPKVVIADSGYYSEANVKKCESRKISPYIATGRMKHNEKLESRFNLEQVSESQEHSDKTLSVKEEMQSKLKTELGRAIYRVRKSTVEPVFGIIKSVMGFRMFSVRGEANAKGEWSLVCSAFNLKRMHRLTPV